MDRLLLDRPNNRDTNEHAATTVTVDMCIMYLFAQKLSLVELFYFVFSLLFSCL